MATQILPQLFSSPYFLIFILFFTALAGVLVLALTQWAVVILEEFRKVAAAASLDLVQFFSAWNMARLDVTERSAKIEAATDLAALQLSHRKELARVKEDALVLELGYKANRVRLATRSEKAAAK